MKEKRRLFFIIFTVVYILVTMTVAVWAAYFVKGEFKDVFVNKNDYFSADVLYSISSMDAVKQEVGASGVRRQIAVYNYDVTVGDFNIFDVTFDVYAWLDEPIPDGLAYVLYDNNGNAFPISTQEHNQPVISGLVLAGGSRSTVNLAVDFCFWEGEDLANAPGMHVVAVPTSPKRLTSCLIGALFRPKLSDAFAVFADFESTGLVTDYAAFKYRITATGNAPSEGKIVIKWKSNALIPIRINEKDITTVTISEGEYGNGFDRKIELNAQSDHTDYISFFRNTENEMWNTDYQSWDLLKQQISMEYVSNS